MALGLGNNLIRSGGAGNADKLSLDLQFALDKTLTARKGPTPTFLRASGATQVNAAGLIEYAPENLLSKSEEFNDAAWTKDRLSFVTNNITAPDGALTAEKLVEDTSVNNSHRVSRQITLTAEPHTFSVFVKSAERNWVRVTLFDGVTSRQVWFDTTAGVIGTQSGAIGQMTSFGNGWWRCAITATGVAAISQTNVALATADNISTYTGDGTSGIYLWGAQLERSSTARAYIPTTTAAVYGARFDHDPLTQACKGLLIEEQRINSILQSDNFASASWTQSLLTVSSNVTSSPDGSTSGDLITEDSTTGIHQINQPSPIITAGQAYTLSVFAKAASHNCFQISFPAIYGSGLFCNFILSGSGSLGNKDATSVARIESYPNGWYRCSLTAPSVVGGSASPVAILAINNNSAAVRNTSYLGTGAQVVSLWGAQLEAGAFPTSYIPTTTGPVTRSADVCTIIGTDFSSFYNQVEGTAVTKVTNAAGIGTTTQYPFSFSGATVNDLLITYRAVSTKACRFSATASGSDSLADLSSAGAGTLSDDATNTIGFAIKSNDFAGSLDGNLITDSTVTLPTVDRMFIGSRVDGTRHWGGHIARIQYFRKRLSNAKLQTLTT